MKEPTTDVHRETRPRRPVVPTEYDRAMVAYKLAVAEFEDAQATLAARLWLCEDRTPEERLRHEAARQKLDNARLVLLSCVGS